MAKFLNIVFIAVLLSFFKCFSDSACVNTNPCLCQIDEYKKIDLTPLSQTLKSEDFLEDEDSKGNSFFFRGCTDGTFNATVHKFNTFNGTSVFPASFVRVNTSDPFNNNTNVTYGALVGKSSEIQFTYDNSYHLVYNSGGSIIARIDLICVNYGQSYIKAISNEGTNPVLTFNSPLACVITEHPGISTGSVLLLMFFIALGIYFVGGCIIMYFMRGARGLEMIPNIDFWRSLPGLMRDGVIFLFSGCNANSITTPETYDRI